MAQYTDIDRNADFDYFVNNYDDLYAKYGHKFIAIKNQKILGAYSSVLDGINSLSAEYEVGSYIIQECTGDKSAYRTTIMRLIING